MNTEHILQEQELSTQKTTVEQPVKEVYHAPQVKIHGKLERLTLQPATSIPTGGGNEAGAV